MPRDRSTALRVGKSRSLPEDWDTLAGPSDLYASAAWFASQASGFDELGGVAATVRARDGTLVAGLPMFPLQNEAPVSTFVHPARLLSRSLDGVDASRLMPSLLCGGRHPTVTRAPTHATGDRPSLLAHLISAAVTHANEASLSSVAFLFVDGHDKAFRSALRNAGFTELCSIERFVLDIEWPNFAGYIASRTGHRRRRINHELRRFSAKDIQMETTDLRNVDLDALVDLTAQRRAKYGKETDSTSMKTVFERLERNFGECARVFLARIGERIAGYTLAFEWLTRMYAWSTGFDYELQGNRPLYFGVTYYEPIAYAIENGFSAIDYGPTAGEAKRLRGCRSVGQYSYYRAIDAEVDRWLREQIARVHDS